jgi:hypothetical protein
MLNRKTIGLPKNTGSFCLGFLSGVFVAIAWEFLSGK